MTDDLSGPPTLRDRPGAGPTAAVDSTIAAQEPVPLGAHHAALSGYSLGAEIGRGGMGEVVAARDDRIGREVAIKRMRGETSSPPAIDRFLREARIQARLEHPAIVPVHELGYDAEGQPYFTMKRITGVTLAHLLATKAPRQRLLRALADVCRAIEFAHARGVVHRDLKPSNIMLGDFGEVYVLDWGLARVLGDRDREHGSVAADVESIDGSTRAGTVLGTPGFMAPEQVRGAQVGTPSDIYALGAIMFAVLAGEPLHPSGDAALASTIAGSLDGPAKRAPGGAVPPELDALCISALSGDPAVRPSARDLADKVERSLDGDRDLERRRELAATWLDNARAALDSHDVGRRAEAMQAAGRALALDPESRDAADLVTRLMLEPAGALPAELERELAAGEATVQRRQSRAALSSFLGVAAFLAMASWNGLRSVGQLAIVAAVTGVMAATAFRLAHRHASRAEMLAVVVGNATLAALLSRAFGSLIVAPAVTCVMAVSLTSYPQLIDSARAVIAVLALSWLAPVGLESAGWLESTWRVSGDSVISSSSLVAIAGTPTTALLIAANLIAIGVIGLFANALARSRRDAQRQVEIQAWHLRQLLPAAQGSR
jgi:serine/threonine-protein kinase